MNLAYSKLLGDANLINLETERVQAVTVADIQHQARTVLRPDNCATLFYHADPKAPETVIEEEV
jgi:zinc protease